MFNYVLDLKWFLIKCYKSCLIKWFFVIVGRVGERYVLL